MEIDLRHLKLGYCSLSTVESFLCGLKSFQASLKMANSKGNRVELRTFLNYGKSEIIGYKTEDSEGRKYVNFIWCKVCARNKDGILSHPTLRGNTKTSALAFINGTNVVTKHQVC